MTIHHNSCPSCNSDKISNFLNCRDNLVTVESFTVAKCGSCGFFFTQDYPDSSEIGRYYQSEDYISHTGSSRNLFEKLYSAAREIMLRSKSGLISRACNKETGKLLDIGSGTGNFVHAMMKAGWDSTGVEINEKARKLSISELGINAISPDEIKSLQSESFDCITLWHVLEHFHDPFRYASEIVRLLKPGGVCVIALPNSRSFDAEHYRNYWAAYDVPRHLWHFNPETFRLFADKTGFKTKNLLTLPLDLFYISILSEKYKGSRLHLFKGIAIAITYTFTSFFNKKRSSSIIYILRKIQVL